jgi:hypothetical protein
VSLKIVEMHLSQGVDVEVGDSLGKDADAQAKFPVSVDEGHDGSFRVFLTVTAALAGDKFVGFVKVDRLISIV